MGNPEKRLEFFARQNCDIVVLEVGMGGALDEMV